MLKKPAIVGGKPVRKSFLVFGSPLIQEDEIREVVKSMRSGWIGKGPKVKEFEESFMRYKGSKYAIALNSCTSALHLALLSLGIKKGDEVITTAMTFSATVNAIIHTGARPVLVDCERSTMNIDPVQIRKNVTSRTKAIIAVHFAGLPCRMEEIMDLVKSRNLKLVEDCAHAIESEYRGRKTGRFGDMGCFSFYVTKNITTAEGGMFITDSKQYADKASILALHGMTKDAWNRFGDKGYKHYRVILPGFKYNMTDIQAAMGVHQLKRIEEYWKRRERVWIKYNDAFVDLPCILPPGPGKETKHAYHLYTLILDTGRLRVSRDFILSALTKENIGVGVHYTSIHEHPYYKKYYGYKKGDFPDAEFISRRTVSLPLSAKLSGQDTDDVVEAVRKILLYYARK